jgi:hypothetical protein
MTTATSKKIFRPAARREFDARYAARRVNLDLGMVGGRERMGEKALTTVNDAMDVVQICQAFQDCQCNLPYDVDVDSPNFLVDAIQGPLVREFHADADIGIGEKRAIE